MLEICEECIDTVIAYHTKEPFSYSPKKLGYLDFKTRKESGFTCTWFGNNLRFVPITEKADLKRFSEILRIESSSLAKSTVKVDNPLWSQAIPYLVYRSIAEAADAKSPASVWLGGRNNEIYIPHFKMGADSGNFIHGLRFHAYRVGNRGLALSVDYIRKLQEEENEEDSDEASIEGEERLNSSQRLKVIEELLDQLVPADGLPFTFGGIELLLPNKPVILKLEGSK